MPGRDGTGPLGDGAMTGRGFGYCQPGRAAVASCGNQYYGMRCGGRRGAAGREYGRRLFANQVFVRPFANEKQVLADELKILEDQIKTIRQRLDEIDKD